MTHSFSLSLSLFVVHCPRAVCDPRHVAGPVGLQSCVSLQLRMNVPNRSRQNFERAAGAVELVSGHMHRPMRRAFFSTLLLSA